MSKMGRPPKPIDWEQFDKLCKIQCSLREIAAWFECSEDTIERRCESEKNMSFADYANEKRALGKVTLKRRQYEVAMEGNIPMLIWLGKNWLEQYDKQDIEIKETITIQTKLEAIRNTVINMIVDQPRKGLLGATSGDREATTTETTDGVELNSETELPKEPVPSS